MHTKIWALIKYLLSMATFLLVGIFCLLTGEELLIVVVKAIASYIISTLILGFVGSIFFALMEKNETKLENNPPETETVEQPLVRDDVDTYEPSEMQVPVESEKG
ncbi:MAG: hypothetical protein SNJ70_00905 [Armatimonadota bacterium]